jgi:transcriptional regulator of acetoin/glycerol metabolism
MKHEQFPYSHLSSASFLLDTGAASPLAPQLALVGLKRGKAFSQWPRDAWLLLRFGGKVPKDKAGLRYAWFQFSLLRYLYWMRGQPILCYFEDAELREHLQELEVPVYLDDHIKRFFIDNSRASPGSEMNEIGNRQTLFFDGPMGAGKTTLAQLFHAKSRPQGRFEVASAPELKDSEKAGALLLGTKKGVYTGAVERMGLMQKAHNGTIFLDDFQTLPLESQAVLLKLISPRTRTLRLHRYLTPDDHYESNVRWILASNVPFSLLKQKHSFREDLLARVGDRVKLRSLREVLDHSLDSVGNFGEKRSPEEKRNLFRWFAVASAEYILAERAQDELNFKKIASVDVAYGTFRMAIETYLKKFGEELIQHPWPGNFRQLGKIACRIFGGLDLEPPQIRAMLAEEAEGAEGAIARESGEGARGGPGALIPGTAGSPAEQMRATVLRILRQQGGDLRRLSSAIGYQAETAEKWVKQLRDGKVKERNMFAAWGITVRDIEEIGK